MLRPHFLQHFLLAFQRNRAAAAANSVTSQHFLLVSYRIIKTKADLTERDKPCTQVFTDTS